MRLILRTQAAHSRIRGKGPFNTNPDDYAVVVDGPVIARIYLEKAGPQKGKWYWAYQIIPTATGYADTLEEAKEEIAKRYNRTGDS
jgi:hypothetical protein